MLSSEWLLSRVTMLAIHCFSRLVGVFERLEGFSQVNHRIRMFIELQSLRLSEKRVIHTESICRSYRYAKRMHHSHWVSWWTFSLVQLVDVWNPNRELVIWHRSLTSPIVGFWPNCQSINDVHCSTVSRVSMSLKESGSGRNILLIS